MEFLAELYAAHAQGFAVAVLLCLALLLVLSWLCGRAVQRLSDERRLRKAREDAVKRSRAVLGGQFGEQIAPFMPGFPCNPGDVRFVGKPVDFVAFPGTAEGLPVREVWLIEVKSGESGLSPREKEIRDAVRNGRVRYVEYRLPEP